MSKWSKIATINTFVFLAYSLAMFLVRTSDGPSYMEAGSAMGGFLFVLIVVHILGLLVTSVINIGADREVIKGALMGALFILILAVPALVCVINGL